VERFVAKDLNWYLDITSFCEYYRMVEEIIRVNRSKFSKVPLKGNLEFIELKNNEKNTVAKVIEPLEHYLESLLMMNQRAALARKKIRTHKWVPEEPDLFYAAIPGTSWGEWVEREEPLDVEEG
jgi:hypothetical protein